MMIAPPHNKNAQFSAVFRTSIVSDPAAPVFISATIIGTPEVGNTLSLHLVRTGFPVPSATYQWTRDGVDIAGATSATYTLVGADDGTQVGVDIVLTNSEGSDSGASNEVTVSPASNWILTTGAWSDSGEWDDADNWKDAA